MNPRRSSVVAILILVFFALPAAAAKRPQADRTKVLVAWEDARTERVPVSGREHGGDDVAELPAYRVLSLPPAAVERLQERARKAGLTVTHRDDFDVLFLPGGQLDTRRGDGDLPFGRKIAAYARGVSGLYVVQLVAPTTEAWLAQLEGAGARVVQYVPQNGYIVAATTDAAEAVDALPFVQWVSPYHPALKAKPRAAVTSAAPMQIEVASGTDVEAALGGLLLFDANARVISRHLNRVVVAAELDGAEIERLLAEPQILSISPAPVDQLSDERQVMSTTSNVNASLSQPTNPGTYQTWLGNVCNYCTNLLAHGFTVGLADTGIDAGQAAGNTHLDLGTRVRWGTDFTTSVVNDRHRDISGHGTLVAGMLVGDNSLGNVDAGSFFLGTGMAPTAGVLSTRIFRGSLLGGGTFDWAADATNNGVYVQNHSHNTYRDNFGQATMDGHYSYRSPQFDEAVRDSNGFAQAGGAPISLVTSAGNMDPPLPRPLYVLPAGTAKNVITAGGVENYRTDPSETSNQCRGTFTGGFKTISKYGKYGTIVPSTAPDGFKRQWSTYLKPDVTAPMSHIFSALSPTFGNLLCYQNFQSARYGGDSGTSFASPVAAGAALFARRVYARFNNVFDASVASPALVKAMVIASARSLEGGTVRETGAVLGPRPDDIQGFGLVSTVDMLDANAAKTYTNQTHTFTGSGQASWNAIYYRRDPNKPARVALTWTDPPAANEANPPLVNDLDLSVNKPFSQPQIGTRVPCSVVYYGNNIGSGDNSLGIPCNASVFGLGQDYRNNAELVSLQPGSAFSPLYVTVNPKQVVGRANPAHPAGLNQDFALYAFNLSQRGDLNHNGKVDLIFRNASADNRPFVWLDVAAGTRTYLAALAYPWTIEALGDFDQNGSDDLVIRNPSTQAVQIRLLNKTATLSTVTVATAAAGWEVAGAGDFNQDGNVDILLRAYSGADAGKIQIWRMLGTTRYETGTLANTQPDTNFRLEAASDFNGDGKADYLWHHVNNGTVQVWYMSHTTVLSTANFTAMGPLQWRVGAVGDYNNDSVNDIVWRHQSLGTTRVWFGDRAGFPTIGNLATESDLAWKTVGPR